MYIHNNMYIPKPLPTIDGIHFIFPSKPGTSFKYLGVWVSLNLNWDTQINKMNQLEKEKRELEKEEAEARALLEQDEPPKEPTTPKTPETKKDF